MKKLFALALVLVMVLSMVPTAFAAGEKYQYEIYQIFTGNYDSTHNVLTNIVWGKNGTGTLGATVDNTVLDDLVTVNSAAATDSEKLDVINKYADLNTEPFATHATDDETFTISGIPNGYYLIKDKKGSQDGEGESYTTYIVRVVKGDLTLNRKADNIITDKFIKSDDYLDNNGEDDSVTADGKTNNSGVGNKVNFELTVTIPVNAEGYTYYYCVLNDTLSKGLTFDATSVKVTVDGTPLTEGTGKDYILYTGDKTERYDHDGNSETDKIHYTFQVAMLDAKSLAGKTIVLTYSATVNKDAVIGVAGNPNEFTVTYSNDPNYKYDDINDNGRPDVADDVPIGETPVKKTVTYVTGVKLMKVDENGNALTGAEFTVEGSSIKYVLVTQDSFHLGTATKPGTHYKLLNSTLATDDTYTLVAPRTEDTYVPAAPGATEGYVNIGGVWEEYNDSNSAHVGQPIYVKLLANYTEYEHTVDAGVISFPMYYKETVYHVRGDDVNELPAKLPVAGDGIVYLTGLGEGVFTITETVTPAGYNTIDPITLTIDWTAPADPSVNTDCTWEAKAKFGTTAGTELTLNDEGVFELTIENRSGSNLPETGGMGTTLFYVIGGIMVLAAVTLLVTKKRMIAA